MMAMPAFCAAVRPLRSSMSKRSADSSSVREIASASPRSSDLAKTFTRSQLVTARTSQPAWEGWVKLQEFIADGFGDDHLSKEVGKQVFHTDLEK